MEHCTTQKELFSRNNIVTSDFRYFKMSQADLNNLENQKNIQACEQTTLTCVKLVWRRFCPLSAMKTLVESAWNCNNEIQTWYGYSSRKYVCDRNKKESIFCIQFPLTLSLKKWTQHIYFCHEIFEQLLPQRAISSSVRHFKKGANFNLDFRLVPGNIELGTCEKF